MSVESCNATFFRLASVLVLHLSSKVLTHASEYCTKTQVWGQCSRSTTTTTWCSRRGAGPIRIVIAAVLALGALTYHQAAHLKHMYTPTMPVPSVPKATHTHTHPSCSHTHIVCVAPRGGQCWHSATTTIRCGHCGAGVRKRVIIAAVRGVLAASSVLSTRPIFCPAPAPPKSNLHPRASSFLAFRFTQQPARTVKSEGGVSGFATCKTQAHTQTISGAKHSCRVHDASGRKLSQSPYMAVEFSLAPKHLAMPADSAAGTHIQCIVTAQRRNLHWSVPATTAPLQHNVSEPPGGVAPSLIQHLPSLGKPGMPH